MQTSPTNANTANPIDNWKLTEMRHEHEQHQPSQRAKGIIVVALAEQEKKLDQLQNTLLADLIREEELEEEARAELDQLNNQVNEARARLRETRLQVEVSASLSTSTYTYSNFNLHFQERIALDAQKAMLGKWMTELNEALVAVAAQSEAALNDPTEVPQSLE